jgi:transcriptional regulator with XRE-family HTH domain
VRIGDRIRVARKTAGLSQEDLARRSHMSLNGFADIERGHIEDPHYSSLKKIADGLGVPVGELLEGSPKVEVPSDTPAKAEAREAIASLMAEAGEPVHYLAMSQEELLVLFDDVETVEEAKALAKAIRSERQLLDEALPDATFSSHMTMAVFGTLGTAAAGIRRVAERETARIQAEAEEAAKSLELASA